MVAQPPLPDSFPWPARTVEWWQVWAEAPQAARFSATDWQELLNAALLHAAVWGDYDITQVPRLNAITAKYAVPVAAPQAERKGTPLDELANRRAAPRQPRAAGI